jgi:hypothetical protein
MAIESIAHVDFHTVPFTPGNAKLGTTSMDGKVLMQTWSRPYKLTCPTDCVFLDEDAYSAGRITKKCYADTEKPSAFRMRQTDKGAHRRLDLTPPIYQLAPDTGAFHNVMRLHVVGDFMRHGRPDTGYINAIKRQVDQYVTAHNVKPKIFSFTHAWKHPVVARLRKYISLIASCDTLADVGLAVRRGWFVSWHSPDIDMNQAYTDTPSGLLFNCANQRHGTKCVDCRVCWRMPERKVNGDTLPVIGVAFLEHN